MKTRHSVYKSPKQAAADKSKDVKTKAVAKPQSENEGDENVFFISTEPSNAQVVVEKKTPEKLVENEKESSDNEDLEVKDSEAESVNVEDSEAVDVDDSEAEAVDVDVDDDVDDAEDVDDVDVEVEEEDEEVQRQQEESSDEDGEKDDDDDNSNDNEDSENGDDMPKRKRKAEEKSEESRKYPKYSETTEKSLEKFLFGKVSQVAVDVSSDSDSDDDLEEKESKQRPQWAAISADKSDDSSSSSDNEKEQVEQQGMIKSMSAATKIQEKKLKSKKKKPVWHDEDDDNVLVKDVTATYAKGVGKHGKKETSTENYAKTLRKNFSSLMDTPKWADLDVQRQTEDSDDEFFRETTDMLESGKVETLKKGFLEYRKLKDMNHTTHNEGSVIRCAEFHPSAAVGLVAGNNGTASLFQIDGKFNPKMQSVHFENFPVKTAHFTSDGRQFLVGSQHFGHFFAYDMIKGKSIKVPWKEDKDQGSMQRFQVSPTNDLVAFHGRFGNIHVMSTRSRSKLFTLKMNDDVTALTFSPDGEYLYSHGAGGEVYIWDLKAQECVHKFVDDGCLRGTAITISRNNRYLSCGSDSGVVNVYRRQDVIANHSPTPEKIVLNLTTTVTSVKFNPTSEILAMTSEVKDNAVKLLHLPSMTVFANFPSFSYNFKRPNCIDFSLNGGYFSVGNNRGAANLYRLKHFGNY